MRLYITGIHNYRMYIATAIDGFIIINEKIVQFFLVFRILCGHVGSDILYHCQCFLLSLNLFMLHM